MKRNRKNLRNEIRGGDFFLSAQSEHISTPITKPVEAPCSTGNFHEESPKQISCERTEISHLEKQIFILKR